MLCIIHNIIHNVYSNFSSRQSILGVKCCRSGPQVCPFCGCDDHKRYVRSILRMASQPSCVWRLSSLSASRSSTSDSAPDPVAHHIHCRPPQRPQPRQRLAPLGPDRRGTSTPHAAVPATRPTWTSTSRPKFTATRSPCERKKKIAPAKWTL